MRTLTLSCCLVAALSAASLTHSATLVLIGATGTAGANGADGHGSLPPAGDGGPGEDVSETIGPGDPDNDLTVYAGNGGPGGNGGNSTYDLPTVPFAFGGAGGNGGAGGSADALVHSVSTTSFDAFAHADALGGWSGTGGLGGSGQDAPGPPGSGGPGGDAHATAIADATTSSATADAHAQAGSGTLAGATSAVANATSQANSALASANAVGASGTGAGTAGGNAAATATSAAGGGGGAFAVANARGGAAQRTASGGLGVAGHGQATASATSDTGSATAEADQFGGAGAPGAQGPLVSSPLLPGGPGQDSTLNDAVSGSTAGLLTLTQAAVGGNGGPNALGGIAVSHLGATNPGNGALVVESTAIAGYSGGSGDDHTAFFAPPGNAAQASATATDHFGARVEAHSTAIGGGGGIASFIGTAGVGGTGTSRALATGLGEVVARADAVSRTGGLADVEGEATRSGPIASARVAATLASGSVGIYDFYTERELNTLAGFDTPAAPGGVVMPASQASEVSLIAAPKAADVTAWLAGNPNARGLEVLALGSLANHVRAGSPKLGGEFEIDLRNTDFGPRTELALAFLDPSSVGLGLELLHLSFSQNDVTLFDLTFTDTASAIAGLDDVVVYFRPLGPADGALQKVVLSFELDLPAGDPFAFQQDAGFALDFALLSYPHVPEPGLSLLGVAGLALALAVRKAR